MKAAHRWVSPLASYTLTSGYGFRWGKLHPAQDLATPVGSPVHSLSSGTVVFAGWDSTGFGNLVRIQYWDGTVSLMAHNSRLVVKLGQAVTPGPQRGQGCPAAAVAVEPRHPALTIVRRSRPGWQATQTVSLGLGRIRA